MNITFDARGSELVDGGVEQGQLDRVVDAGVGLEGRPVHVEPYPARVKVAEVADGRRAHGLIGKASFESEVGQRSFGGASVGGTEQPSGPRGAPQEDAGQHDDEDRGASRARRVTEVSS